jgi:hypothetical protein
MNNKKLLLFISTIIIALIVIFLPLFLQQPLSVKAEGKDVRTVYLGQVMSQHNGDYFYYFGGITKFNDNYTLTIAFVDDWDVAMGGAGANMFVHIEKGQNLHLSVWTLRIIDFNDTGDWITFEVLP